MGLCTSYGVGKRSYSSDVILRMALVTPGEQKRELCIFNGQRKRFRIKIEKNEYFY